MAPPTHCTMSNAQRLQLQHHSKMTRPCSVPVPTPSTQGMERHHMHSTDCANVLRWPGRLGSWMKSAKALKGFMAGLYNAARLQCLCNRSKKEKI
mmetsp:Transcript_69092/g.115295  ORF Transcript_69092/g.115295 Transcript_69092/m.115295 type:complete len:95 (-) Transcript_69092:1329-1613(-)